MDIGGHGTQGGGAGRRGGVDKVRTWDRRGIKGRRGGGRTGDTCMRTKEEFKAKSCSRKMSQKY